MSNKTNTSPAIRWQLLSTVSACALLVSVYGASADAVTDAEHPLIWLEFGAQMENASGQGQVFSPAFLTTYPSSPVLQNVTPLRAQKPPQFSFGEDGKDFVPAAGYRLGVSAASARIGRSSHGQACAAPDRRKRTT